MNDAYRHVLEPLSLSPHLKLKNRLFFAPMGIDLADENGCFTPAMLDFYKSILAGGCSMAFLSNATVSAQSRLQSAGLGLYAPEQASALKPLLAWSEQVGVPVGVQLQHYGGQGTTTLTDAPVMTPSGVPCPRVSQLDPNYRVRIMDEADIAEVVEQFAHSAWLAWGAGARLVQLQASNGYLLGSFLSPATNQRTDRYGGSEENRARLLLEVIEAIQRRTGPHLLITVRLGIDDRLGEKGLQFSQLKETVQALCRAGVSALECSMCVGATFNQFLTYSPAMDEYLQAGVRAIKSVSTVAVGYAGFIDGLDKAERLLAEGVCDWIGMSRALFADNDLINKTFEGRAHQINRCLWDGQCFKDKSNPRFDRVYCCVNPNYLRPALV
ncbi:NADH:flavin oxidoreductase [Pseudomonas sp. OA65]|uniref:oxidoreductase n=1 Tax=Pseudomonas sp. OA65 TaxID=2818431 RepID=UPI001A9FE139|nr:NADH:flavin oxidoreductase [Pseudomonas sp. OA65]MBO1540734.1 NADH:flavin oxidoreductase [Pseudomonas sp. OA65]